MEDNWSGLDFYILEGGGLCGPGKLTVHLQVLTHGTFSVLNPDSYGSTISLDCLYLLTRQSVNVKFHDFPEALSQAHRQPLPATNTELRFPMSGCTRPPGDGIF